MGDTSPMGGGSKILSFQDAHLNSVQQNALFWPYRILNNNPPMAAPTPILITPDGQVRDQSATITGQQAVSQEYIVVDLPKPIQFPEQHRNEGGEEKYNPPHAFDQLNIIPYPSKPMQPPAAVQRADLVLSSRNNSTLDLGADTSGNSTAARYMESRT